MNGADGFRITPRLIVGLGILAIGLLWALDNFGVLDAGRYVEWWPVILILIGLARLLDPRAGKAASVILIGVGTIFLLNNLELLDWDFFDLIPLFIALVGLKLIWEAFQRRGTARLSERDPNAAMNVFAMWAAVRRQSTSREFRGGEITAIMGGVELDLRETAIKDAEAVIDTFALMGGIELTVPENWTIVSQVLPLMGGVEDKTRPPRDPGPRLVIRGMAIMGGVEVKN